MCAVNSSKDKIAIDINDEEINRRLDQLEAADLPEDLRDYLIRALKILVELDRIVGLQETTILRLRKIFGKKSEKTQNSNDDKKTKIPKEKDGKAKGHGRNGHTDYPGIPEEYHTLEDFSAGDACPNDDSGKLYPYAPRYHIMISGGAPFKAKKVVHETLRCNVCGLVVEAKSDATGKPKYDESVASMLAILHYSCSFPFHRLEKLQKMIFIPMPRSVQWMLLFQLGINILSVWDVLLKLLTNSNNIMSDDTKVKILSHMKNSEKKKRKQLSTTGMRSIVDNHEIIIFRTGENNSGENLDKIVVTRESKEYLTIATDASSTNNLSTQPEFVVHMVNCLTHARRKFIDVEKHYQKEAEKVKTLIGKVYYTESIAKEEKLTPEKRLLLHQELSGPVMDELKSWCDSAFPEKRIEPNSSLGKGVQYVLNHWHELTGFLRIEGAPLDTNILELYLRDRVLNRKNWMFFKTEVGAFIGDIFSSILKTCERANENPYEYLNALQLHEKQVKEAPDQWLPWNFRQNLVQKP